MISTVMSRLYFTWEFVIQKLIFIDLLRKIKIFSRSHNSVTYICDHILIWEFCSEEGSNASLLDVLVMELIVCCTIFFEMTCRSDALTC